jgi:hypothetical protein
MEDRTGDAGWLSLTCALRAIGLRMVPGVARHARWDASSAPAL